MKRYQEVDRPIPYGGRLRDGNTKILRDIVNSFNYKPGYTLRFSDSISRPDGNYLLMLTAQLPNVNGPAEKGNVQQSLLVYYEELEQPDLIRYKIYNMCIDHEMHEIHEWLKFDGKHFKEPHPEIHGSSREFSTTS